MIRFVEMMDAVLQRRVIELEMFRHDRRATRPTWGEMVRVGADRSEREWGWFEGVGVEMTTRLPRADHGAQWT